MKMKLIPMAMAAMLPALLLGPPPAAATEQAAQPCRAEPRQQGQQIPGGSAGNGATDNSRLTDCNGVLHPPTVGDPEMVKPAPDVGKMPVIPPGSVPQSGNGGNGVQERVSPPKT
ncbi:MAG TPA: hypothetical protein VN112_18815 [Ensifer sp.]|nr:hypothetical protein [Ensifer sp.]